MSEPRGRFRPELGWELLNQGRAALLERLARERLAVASRDVDALMLLANALVDLGRAAEAEAAAHSALAVAPDEPHPFSTLGRVLRALGRPADARQAVERAIALAPQWPGYRKQLAEGHRAAGERQAMLEAAEQGLRLDASDPGLWALQAEALLLLDRAPAAQQGLAAGLRLAPGDARLLRLQGLLHLRANEVAAAVACLRESLRRDPTAADAREDLGRALRMHSRMYRWWLAVRAAGADPRMAGPVLSGLCLLLIAGVVAGGALPEVRVPLVVTWLTISCLVLATPGVMTLVVWLHPVGREALPPEGHRACRTAVGGLLLAAAAGAFALGCGQPLHRVAFWALLSSWLGVAAVPLARDRDAADGLLMVIVALDVFMVIAQVP